MDGKKKTLTNPILYYMYAAARGRHQLLSSLGLNIY
jgi:hypothetical protein